MSTAIDAERLASQIVRAAEDMGLEADFVRSCMSEASYVECYDPTSEDPETTTIRVASHESRPTYEAMHGSADFTVGSISRLNGRVEHLIITSNGDWIDAVAWLTNRTGRELPPRIARLRDRRDQKRCEYAAKMRSWKAKYEASITAAKLEREAITNWAKEHTPGLLADIERIVAETLGVPGAGKKGRRRRKAIWAQIEKEYARAHKED